MRDGVIIKGLSVMGTCKTVRTVPVVKFDRARPIDRHREVGSQDPVAVENLLPNEGPHHSADYRLNLVDLQI